LREGEKDREVDSGATAVRGTWRVGATEACKREAYTVDSRLDTYANNKRLLSSVMTARPGDLERHQVR